MTTKRTTINEDFVSDLGSSLVLDPENRVHKSKDLPQNPQTVRGIKSRKNL